MITDPEFKNINVGDFSATDEFSPVVNSGHLSLSSPAAINGLRDSSPDKGAYEFMFDDVIFQDGFE